MWGMAKALLQPANIDLGPDATQSQIVKQKAKWAAVEGTTASITTQLVKQKAKRAAIEDGDHFASITTHIEKKKKKKKKTTTKNR